MSKAFHVNEKFLHVCGLGNDENQLHAFMVCNSFTSKCKNCVKVILGIFISSLNLNTLPYMIIAKTILLRGIYK